MIATLMSVWIPKFIGNTLTIMEVGINIAFSTRNVSLVSFCLLKPKIPTMIKQSCNIYPKIYFARNKNSKFIIPPNCSCFGALEVSLSCHTI